MIWKFPGHWDFPGYGRSGIKTCRNLCRNPGNLKFPGYGYFPGYGNYTGCRDYTVYGS